MYIKKNGYYELEELKKLGVRAIYTTKELGNFQTEESREKILKILNLKEKDVYSGYQTHSDNVVIIEETTQNFIENTDGFITDIKNKVIFTKYADCLPIFLYDKEKEAIGCVHSGWMGSYRTIVLNAIEKMINRYNSKKENIIVAFGIGIQQKNYEVGKEFLEKFENKFSYKLLESVFKEEDGKYYFDNQKFNYNLLKNIGISEENIIANNLCTYENLEFHSYRRDGKESGRNAAYIFIDKNKEK